ncbi:MAG: hypothetical protein J6Z00_00735, partial [Clostridia bacterium]|nr:hypothetical protein [Clostridia bacterium]
MDEKAKRKLDLFFDRFVFKHWAAWYCALTMVLGIVICLCALPNCQTMEYTAKPNDLYGQPQYVQYADAVLKGRLSLDIEPSKELLALENPYNPEGRDGKLYFLWDTAFYNNRYYCYFGIAPVLTTYIPFYFVTGLMPDNVTASMIISIYAVVFGVLAAFALARRLAPKAPLWMVSVASFTLILLANIFTCLSDSKMYMIPLLSGLASGFAFLYFALKALEVKKKWAKNTLWVLSGISYVLIVASRPSMALAFMGFLPLVFFDIFQQGKIQVWLPSLVYLGTPVVLGALAIMWYNGARFSGPFDFGNSYQLTVHDCREYTMSLKMLPYAFIHYFVQGPSYGGNFPWLKASYYTMDYGRYLYVDKCLGVLAYPATIMAFFSPAVCSFKKDLGKTLSFLCIPILCLLVAWVDTCTGVHYRYVYDILAVFSIPALMTWLDVYTRSKGKMK